MNPSTRAVASPLCRPTDYFSSQQECPARSPWHSLICSGLHSPGLPFSFSGCSHPFVLLSSSIPGNSFPALPRPACVRAAFEPRGCQSLPHSTICSTGGTDSHNRMYNRGRVHKAPQKAIGRVGEQGSPVTQEGLPAKGRSERHSRFSHTTRS